MDGWVSSWNWRGRNCAVPLDTICGELWPRARKLGCRRQKTVCCSEAYDDLFHGSTWRAAEAGQDDDGPRKMAQGGGHVLRYHAWEWNMSHDGDHVSITRHSGRQNDEMIRGASWGGVGLCG